MADITSYFTDSENTQDDIFAQIAQSSSNVDLAAPINEANPTERLWFPSSETAALIDRVRKSPQCRDEPDVASSRTVPVVYAEKQGDPIRDQLVLRNRPEAVALRSFPNATLVSKDMTGLKQLITVRCFRSALNLTSELLAPRSMSVLSEQDHSIWSCRFSLLVRLNLAGVAEIEMQAFNNFDNADLYEEFHGESSGASNFTQLIPQSFTSLVPFSTRLLHAQLPQFLQRNSEALDRLSNLLRSVDRILSKLDEKNSEIRLVWQRRKEDVLFAIANVLVAQKNYRESNEIFERLLPPNVEIDARKSRVAAMAGRAFLQSGCLPFAEIYFKRAETNEKFGDFLSSLHSGYLAMAAGQFHEATDDFEQAVTKAPEPALKVQAVTCVAVSIMYSGRLQAAIDRLEAALFSEPAVYTTEALLINLSTMYELHQSNTADVRKMKLLDLVGQYCGDGFDIGCLKLSPVVATVDHTPNLPAPPPVVQMQPPPSAQAPLPGPLQPPTAPFRPR